MKKRDLFVKIQKLINDSGERMTEYDSPTAWISRRKDDYFESCPDCNYVKWIPHMEPEILFQLTLKGIEKTDHGRTRPATIEDLQELYDVLNIEIK